jgi:uncharacterized protein (DUF885 family)
MRIGMVMLVGFAAGAFCAPLTVFAQSGQQRPPSDPVKQFRAYLEADWKRWMEEYPELATGVGYPGQNRRWSDDSPEGIESRKKHLRESLATLRKIDRAALPTSERLNYDLYLDLLQISEEGLQYGDDPMPFRNVIPHNLYLPLNQMEGIHQGVAETLASMPHETVADYEDILARLEALPKSFDQNLALLKEGLKRGYAPPKIAMRDVAKQFTDVAPADPSRSAFLEPFNDFPRGFREAERIRLRQKSREIYMSAILPAVEHFHDYVANTYIPACRDSVAASAIPNGAAAYAFHVADHHRAYTATNPRNWPLGGETYSNRNGKAHPFYWFQGQLS